MSQMRKVIAKRMSQSALTAPHIYFFTDVEMDRLDRLRAEILPDFEKQFGIRISINDLLIKAVALTIREFPILNAILKDEEIVVMPEINIGLAVAMDEGLIVPAIPHADQLSLGEIAKLRADLVERARARKLKLEEIERGTFTISSLAQFDITFFTAILNPPQSGILSIGKTADHLALKEGKIISKKIARFGLSVDHRIIDGVVAASFLQTLKNRLETMTLTSC
jgi:pyruvate dehydrogenase E2 component (dihydrolipoamide acetyltransferase)